MFERFTDRSRKILATAHQQTQRFDHTHINVDFVMLAFLKHAEGMGAEVLKRCGVDIESLHNELESKIIFGKPPGPRGRLPQTTGAKDLIKHSVECARNLNHNYVGSEHLLMALFQSEEGISSELLRNRGLDLETLEETIRSVLGMGPAPELQQLVVQVQDQESFLRFAGALMKDRELEVREQDATPIDWCRHGPRGWENHTIEDFLKAAIAWARDFDFGDSQGLNDVSVWRKAAAFLYCGKTHE